jgi:lysine 2,3-aminomutase
MALQAWHEQLKGAVRSVSELDGYAFTTTSANAVEQKYRTLVPRYYLGLVNPKDPNDPIAKMAFPQEAEISFFDSGLRDPIGDLAKQAAKRLTHRYKDRALLHVTNLCPMYCRFCFRKNLMNEADADLYSGDFADAFAYLKEHSEINELILTGGDPWMLADEKLAALMDEIALKAPAVKRVRFHTRMPVTLPSRVTDALLQAIVRPERFQLVVVMHFNHPRELSAEAELAVKKLRSAGILLLNQSVLLRGVNDCAETLRQLFSQLGDWGVLPYYLHHCDTVAGAEHFRLPIVRGQKIWADLRGTLPGYLLPEYVLDVPGGMGKIPLSAGFVEPMGQGSYRVNSRGLFSDYSDQQIH